MALDRRERSGELVEALLCAQEGHQAEMWTSLPAIVQSFNPVNQTCVLQCALKFMLEAPDGTRRWVTMPPLVDVLVQFPRGGGFVLTFPLAQGDEGLVVFASRCIDAWWQNGGVQVQAEMRMHDLSDGFFLPGFSSVPNVAPSIATDGVMLRNVAGDAYVKIDSSKKITVQTPGNLVGNCGPLGVHATGDATVTSDGNVTVTGGNINLNGVLYINGKKYVDHTHTDPQGGNTGGVNP